MRMIGFSTGSLAHGDFRRALGILQDSSARAVELSALRRHELRPLTESLDSLDLSRFGHVSVHAPSAFAPEDEREVLGHLREFSARGWPIVVHPDAIHTFEDWRTFGPSLLIENMDKRKPTGRSVSELQAIFTKLPEARLCFDIAHARQYDSSMTEAYLILREFSNRLGQIHISEVGTQSGHCRISPAAMWDFQEVAHLVPHDVPIILETPVDSLDLESEMEVALASLSIPVAV